jgi:putative glycosyltransferase (TIGR04372 family)
MTNTKLTRDESVARLVAFVLDSADRAARKDFCQSCLFVFLPFRWAMRLTVAFRKHQRRRDLDHHFKFFCGAKLERNLAWLHSDLVARGYANEVWYYLYITGHYQQALDLFPRLDWNSADECFLSTLDEFARDVNSGYSMNLLAQAHCVGWHVAQRRPLAEFARLIRTMMDNRTFELEERLYREREANDPELAHAEIDRYVPYFFRNKSVHEKLQTELGLPRHPEIISELDSAGQYWEPFPHANGSAEALDVACFYAYRHLQSRAYNNGEGAWVRALSEGAAQNQNELRRHMPVVSSQLKSELKTVGISEIDDLRLLSPDWGAVIGHCGHLNVHLMMRELGWWAGSPLLLTYADKVANRPFLSLMKDRCPIWILEEDVSFAIWHELASLTPFVGEHQTFRLPDGRSMNWNDAGAMAVAEWERQGRGFPVRVAYDELTGSDHRISEQVDQLRRKWGMTPRDWYVCLHMRDAATRGNVEGAGESIRNTEWRNYLESVEYILSIGGWVIRMGGPKAPQLPPMDRVIDYAHTAVKNPEMDIHLVRNARAFIGTTSGFAYVATSFGIPSAIVDAISSIGLLWTKQTRFTTKLVRTRTGRSLSLAELTSDRFRWSLANFETLTRAELTVEDNSPDEILEAVREVLTLGSTELAGNAGALAPAWNAGFEIPDFFGAASPSRYFVDKHRDLLK